MNKTWMIYGCYGYTGRLLTDEALKRGCKPLLAGRNEEKVKKMAAKYDLEFRVFNSNDPETIRKNLAGISLLYNLAGPYRDNQDKFLNACLEVKSHYIDLAGETDISQNAYNYHNKALMAGITIVTACGFNVIATECMAAYAASKVEEPRSVDVAMAAVTRPSSGTFRQTMAILPEGGRILQNGEITEFKLGEGAKMIKFPHGEYKSFPVPMAELIAIKHSLDVPNAKVFLALSGITARTFEYFSQTIIKFIKKTYGKKLIEILADTLVKGPGYDMNLHEKAYIWSKAVGKDGDAAEAYLITREAYY
ncbi:MAG: saccharopine dehydrogenase NADP-binding domain-containing protein, partial [Bacteroidota bacterium]